MDDLISGIKKNIPSSPHILGYYDDEQEKWIKAPPEEILKLASMEISDITVFVRNTVRELTRLNPTFGIERVSFDLYLSGNRVRFSVLIKPRVEKAA